MVQIPIITSEDDLVKLINDRFSQVAREINKIEREKGNSNDSIVTQGNSNSTTTSSSINAKYIRLGVMSASNAPDGSLFEDEDDGILYWKNRSGALVPLV